METTDVLILSPHCDDVPLSLGASILAGVWGKSIRVVVVFSQSAYTRLGRWSTPVRDTTALRIREERRAAYIAGYKVRFLGFPEPFVRPGYTSVDDIFDSMRLPELEPNWQSVHDSILAIMQSHRGVVLAPLGCGAHIDHRIVSACFRECVSQLPAATPGFYEDLPYAAWWNSGDTCSLVPSELGGVTFDSVVLRGGRLEDKLKLLSVYESQLGDEDLNCVRNHWACRGHSELAWMPKGWMACC